MPVSLEREKIMQSICSLAAVVLAVAKSWGFATSNEAGISEAADVKVVMPGAAWPGTDGAQVLHAAPGQPPAHPASEVALGHAKSA